MSNLTTDDCIILSFLSKGLHCIDIIGNNDKVLFDAPQLIFEEEKNEFYTSVDLFNNFFITANQKNLFFQSFSNRMMFTISTQLDFQ